MRTLKSGTTYTTSYVYIYLNDTRVMKLSSFIKKERKGEKYYQHDHQHLVL